MRDEETGSWWQQVTGEAIQGPLKGQHLRSVFHDELTFALWKREQPDGRILRPDQSVDRANQYESPDWEEKMTRVRVTAAHLDTTLPPRTLVVGVTVNGKSKAYPFEALVRQSPVLDEVAGSPLLLVVGPDRKSVRAFERFVDGHKAEFFSKTDVDLWHLVDAETGSSWDFTGKAISGPLTGHQLKQVSVLNDYWFDWKTYNPSTTIYDLGER